MLQHWLNELAIWAPGLRRILVHQSGAGDGLSRNVSPQMLRLLVKWLQQSRSDRIYEAIDEIDQETMDPHSFCGTGYVIITTYDNLRRNPTTYEEHDWSYVVLDEAQRIRNPDADVTAACKRIRTPHRLALSGTPIQVRDTNTHVKRNQKPALMPLSLERPARIVEYFRLCLSRTTWDATDV